MIATSKPMHTLLIYKNNPVLFPWCNLLGLVLSIFQLITRWTAPLTNSKNADLSRNSFFYPLDICLPQYFWYFMLELHNIFLLVNFLVLNGTEVSLCESHSLLYTRRTCLIHSISLSWPMANYIVQVNSPVSIENQEKHGESVLQEVGKWRIQWRSGPVSSLQSHSCFGSVSLRKWPLCSQHQAPGICKDSGRIYFTT